MQNCFGFTDPKVAQKVVQNEESLAARSLTERQNKVCWVIPVTVNNLVSGWSSEDLKAEQDL